VFEAFAERDYRRFWTAQFFSNIGSWMEAVAQGYLVYKLTDSAFLLGFVGFAHAMPSVFLMLYGGVIADHFDRRRIVTLSQWTQAATAMALAISILTNHLAVWQIIAAAAINGIAISFSAPAWQAMVLDLLDDRSRLPNAIAMNSLQFQLSRALGPLLAGATLAAVGGFWCFFFNSLSFLPLIWILGRVKPRQQTMSERSRVWDRLRAGFLHVLSDRMILLALSVSAVASLFGFPYLTLMPVVARQLFPANEAQGLGWLVGAVGIGAMLGSLSLSIRTPPHRYMLPAILTCLALFGACLTTIGFLRAPAVVLPLLFLCGLAMVVCLALCNTSIQQRVPDIMRGRVMSMYTFSFYAFAPFGNLGSGTLAEHFGIARTFLVLGVTLLVSAAIASTMSRRGMA
jgi:MFS family permease